jgi:hypothetical protein
LLRKTQTPSGESANCDLDQFWSLDEYLASFSPFLVRRRFQREGITMFPNRRVVAWALIAGSMSIWTTGCFSSGGKTTYVDEGPETKARIAGLESRVGALEQSFSPTVGPTMYPASAAADGREPQAMR